LSDLQQFVETEHLQWVNDDHDAVTDQQRKCQQRLHCTHRLTTSWHHMVMTFLRKNYLCLMSYTDSNITKNAECTTNISTISCSHLYAVNWHIYKKH